MFAIEFISKNYYRKKTAESPMKKKIGQTQNERSFREQHNKKKSFMCIAVYTL